MKRTNKIKKLSLFLLYTSLHIFTYACGSGGGSAETAPNGDADNKSEERVENETETVRDISKTLMVDSVSQAQVCSKENLSQLIYSKAEESFYVCDSDGWVAIDLKGRDGLAGKDGIDGTDGIDGQDGEDSPFHTNRWIDSVTGNEWFVGGIVSHAYAFSTGCPAGYRIPTKAEATQGVANGLSFVMIELNADDDFWTTAAATGGNPVPHATYLDPSPGNSAGLVCLK